MKSLVDVRKEYKEILHIGSLEGKSIEYSIHLLGKLIDYSVLHPVS